MRTLTLLLLLLTTSAFAQDGVVRGGALRKREYQTYSALTLYVDPTGSDSNACTASGTSACATLTGALGKLPRFINHAVTINVANGTYSESVAISNYIEPPNGAMTITGSLTNVTPATGTATGSLTAVANTGCCASVALATMTDGAQTWTTNDFRGAFLVMTSGTQSGQVRPIVSNTATTLTLSTPFNAAPAVSDTYAIQVPGATFSGTTALSLRLNAHATGAFAVNSIGFAGTGTSGFAAVLQNNAPRLTSTFTNVRFTTTAATSNSAVSLTGNGNYTLSRCSVVGGATGLQVVTSPNTAALAPTGSYVVGGLNGTGYGMLINTVFGLAASGFVVETAANSYAAMSVSTGGQMYLASFSSTLWNYFKCASGSTGTAGLRIGHATTGVSQFNIYGVGAAFPNAAADNCVVGFDVEGPGIGLNLGTLLSTTGCATATTCIAASGGAQVNMPTATVFSAVTNELQVDGTNYTYAFFTGLSPKRIVGTQGSYLFAP